MFKKPVWDDLSFVTMVHYPAGSSHQKMVHCSHKGTWSVTILWEAVAFKRCSIGAKGPKVCQENIPLTITPPPPAWTVETRQDGSMLSCSLCQILTLTSECRSRNRDSSDQATFFQSSIVLFWWACVNCMLRFLFLGYRSGTRCGLCCCSPSASGFDVLCIQRLVISVTVAFLSSLTSLPILLWPLTSTRHFRPHICHSLNIFSFLNLFSVNPRISL